MDELDVDVIYFLQEAGRPGYVKVGTTTLNGLKRCIGSVQRGNPRPLRLRRLLSVPYGYGRFAEQKLHHRFRDLRVRGEWFRAEVLLEPARGRGFRKLAIPRELAYT